MYFLFSKALQWARLESSVLMFDTPLVGSLTYNIKCVEATVVGIWCYMNKTHLNIVN